MKEQNLILHRKEQHLILHRHLNQLEMEKAGIEHAINEIQRRFALLDEVESWGLLVKKEAVPDYPSADYPSGNSLYDGGRLYGGYDYDDNQDNNGDREEVVSFAWAGNF